MIILFGAIFILVLFAGVFALESNSKSEVGQYEITIIFAKAIFILIIIIAIGYSLVEGLNGIIPF